jgi:hypothetical protein
VKSLIARIAVFYRSITSPYSSIYNRRVKSQSRPQRFFLEPLESRMLLSAT